jgi:hypothetical protein
MMEEKMQRKLVQNKHKNNLPQKAKKDDKMH